MGWSRGGEAFCLSARIYGFQLDEWYMQPRDEPYFRFVRYYQQRVSHYLDSVISIETNYACLLHRNGQPYSEWDKSLSIDQKSVAAEAVGSWTFSAHSFSDDELLYCALLMLQHALSAPELEHWRLTPGMFLFDRYVVIANI